MSEEDLDDMGDIEGLDDIIDDDVEGLDEFVDEDSFNFGNEIIEPTEESTTSQEIDQPTIPSPEESIENDIHEEESVGKEQQEEKESVSIPLPPTENDNQGNTEKDELRIDNEEQEEDEDDNDMDLPPVEEEPILEEEEVVKLEAEPTNEEKKLMEVSKNVENNIPPSKEVDDSPIRENISKIKEVVDVVVAEESVIMSELSGKREEEQTKADTNESPEPSKNPKHSAVERKSNFEIPKGDSQVTSESENVKPEDQQQPNVEFSTPKNQRTQNQLPTSSGPRRLLPKSPNRNLPQPKKQPSRIPVDEDDPIIPPPPKNQVTSSSSALTSSPKPQPSMKNETSAPSPSNTRSNRKGGMSKLFSRVIPQSQNSQLNHYKSSLQRLKTLTIEDMNPKLQKLDLSISQLQKISRVDVSKKDNILRITNQTPHLLNCVSLIRDIFLDLPRPPGPGSLVRLLEPLDQDLYQGRVLLGFHEISLVFYGQVQPNSKRVSMLTIPQKDMLFIKFLMSRNLLSKFVNALVSSLPNVRASIYTQESLWMRTEQILFFSKLIQIMQTGGPPPTSQPNTGLVLTPPKVVFQFHDLPPEMKRFPPVGREGMLVGQVKHYVSYIVRFFLHKQTKQGLDLTKIGNELQNPELGGFVRNLICQSLRISLEHDMKKKSGIFKTKKTDFMDDVVLRILKNRAESKSDDPIQKTFLQKTGCSSLDDFVEFVNSTISIETKKELKTHLRFVVMISMALNSSALEELSIMLMQGLSDKFVGKMYDKNAVVGRKEYRKSLLFYMTTLSRLPFELLILKI